MSERRSIAIVGVAGRFPGAPDVASLWQNVVANRSAVRDVGESWPVPPADVLGAGLADRAVSSRAAPLDPFDLHVDALDLPPDWLPRLSALTRLTLQVGAEAWRSVRGEGHPERTSIILANIALPTDAASRFAETLFLGPADAAVSTRQALPDLEPFDAFPSALPAGILARALGLGGGSFTLDAACASSLYAVYLACSDLEAGRADAVLTGGVSLPQALYTQVGFSQLLALSPRGVCAPYGEDADGLVVGEGAAMFVLKRLVDARRDGDQVLGVIRGIGLSNDVGGSLLSPETEGQVRAMRSAYAEAGWRADEVDLIEGHGTGTPRGDSVEIASLAELWRGLTPRGCVLGSVKSNVGHLLTAAGAAALCKVLAALSAGKLPPSANVEKPSAALVRSPFRLLSAAEEWPRTPDGRPRRAAVSGFGFGGINAHLLVEEDDGGAGGPAPSRRSPTVRAPCRVALVGMSAHVGRLETLGSFQRAALLGESLDDELPAQRWHGLDAGDSSAALTPLRRLRGAWIDSLSVPLGRFKLPPADVPAVLPQQLLMLKVAAEALTDARISGSSTHLRTGAVIGLGLDLETTSFHLRWLAKARVRRWAAELALELSEAELDSWAEELRDSLAPALDAIRTLGALGGIVPSRVAREFHLGGPSFAVADDEASGLRAFEIATRMLQRREADVMLVGAVDLAGDVRTVLATHRLRPFSVGAPPRPFDAAAAGGKVAEGAAAIVLKRLEDAHDAGDHIYAVVTGMGVSGAGALDLTERRVDAYVRAAADAYREGNVRPMRVGLVEAHGSAVPAEDAVELRALGRVFGDTGGSSEGTAIGSLAGSVGRAGAAAGLMSVVKAASCLHYRVRPPIGEPDLPSPGINWAGLPLHLPRLPAAWVHDRKDGPRVAAVGAMGQGGSCLHALLEEHYAGRRHLSHVPGARRAALFLLRDASDRDALRELSQQTADLESLAVRWHEQARGTTARVSRAIVASGVSDLRVELDRSAPAPPSLRGRVAVVFPGSGNHYLGMGRELALAIPDVYARLDQEVGSLASHLQPALFGPQRTSWAPGWEEDALRDLTAHPERILLAQVAHGVAVHDALVHVGLRPQAYIGYSLGESTALFAARIWPDRELMFERTRSSPLFRSDLCGARRVLREAWGDEADWSVVIVTRGAAEVRKSLVGTTSLLIVNAPRECVIGGTTRDVEATIRALGCEAVRIDGVPTVHLPLVAAVQQAYRDHHVLPAAPRPDVSIYSGAWAEAYVPTSARAADSIVLNALQGFDFSKLIKKAWEDGVRIFVEAGPQGSCTRMIGRILEGRPHLAVSACVRGQDGYRALLTAVGRVAEAGAPVDLDALYGKPPTLPPPARLLPPIVLGGVRRPVPTRPLARRAAPTARTWAEPSETRRDAPDLSAFFAAARATTAAHATFLRVAAENLALQTRLLLDPTTEPDPRGPPAETPPRFERAACLAFAVGKIASVLGPDFADVDHFPTRVRLPDEPLMLVDRILAVDGTMGTLGAGRVVTEHDVHADAWYLDGDRAPVCISVEAGQADLFLSAYLGIDRETRGERVYRLLDARIAFHRDLPRPGDRIRYDIHIDRFICQGETWLFFFRFEGTIDGQPFITMKDGCAGFFSQEQLDSGRGIVASPPAHARPAAPIEFRPLVDLRSRSLDDAEVDALRRGDLEAAFGAEFAGKTLAPALRLPGGRMRLVDRIVSLDPTGGTSRLGEVVGEADVAPDAWYLKCHFVGDEVMPGTLMYECCLHTLRVLLLGLGWISTDAAADLHYGPVAHAVSELRCRGQVTRRTRKVRYRVTIAEIGYDPAPYVLASASMFADERHVVQMDGMSVRIHGLTRERIESEWRVRLPARPAFTREQVVAYAEGKPSECFGAPYAIFDSGRRLARLPRDPYLFVDRVLTVEPPPWTLQPGGWVTCAFDVAPEAWYFGASGQDTMPFAILLEAALQPCGFVAAYLGSALLSQEDLRFRNLDGEGTQLAEVERHAGSLTTRARLTKTSQAGGMILQEFDLEVSRGDDRIYIGKTGFGFFPAAALAAQVGLRGAEPWSPHGAAPGESLPRVGPRTPLEARAVRSDPGMTLPAAALSMIDHLEVSEVAGGPSGLGLVVGSKRVDPEEWFFRAHFFQDPVMPGSLGLEALLELMKIAARERFPALNRSHRFQSMAVGHAHRWQYRGQVVPRNTLVRVECRLTAVVDGPEPLLVADGQLAVDGKIIYAMKDFAIRLVAMGSS